MKTIDMADQIVVMNQEPQGLQDADQGTEPVNEFGAMENDVREDEFLDD